MKIPAQPKLASDVDTKTLQRFHISVPSAMVLIALFNKWESLNHGELICSMAELCKLSALPERDTMKAIDRLCKCGLLVTEQVADIIPFESDLPDLVPVEKAANEFW